MHATVTASSSTIAAAAPRRRAIDVEALLRWTYAQQKAHLVCREGRGLVQLEAELDGVEGRHGSSSAAAVGRILELGCIPDQSAPDPGALHPDAELIHRAVEQLTQRTQGLSLAALLMLHARQSDRPEHLAGVVQRPQPMLTVRGRVHVEWSDAGRRSGHCPIVWEPSTRRIDQARTDYAAWHAGLVLLAVRLRLVPLTIWRATPPGAPAAPWQHRNRNQKG